MKILEVRKEITTTKTKLIGLVQYDNKDPIEVYYEFDRKYENFINVSADAFVACSFIPSMFYHEDLEVIPQVSEQLIYNLNQIKGIYCQWYPELKNINVKANNLKTKEYGHKNIGSFFSLGVDSFYTLFKNNNIFPPISHIIYMSGVEESLSSMKDEKDTIAKVKEIGEKTHKQVIIGKTNMRDCFPIIWSKYYNGSGLSSIAIALSNGFSKVLLPSSFKYIDIFPWGSSPLTDHLWSNEKTRIIHDGSEVGRTEKIISIVDESLFIDNVRVCLYTFGENKNCGKCSKCVRTMLSLFICGKLKEMKTFPDKLPDNWEDITSKKNN